MYYVCVISQLIHTISMCPQPNVSLGSLHIPKGIFWSNVEKQWIYVEGRNKGTVTEGHEPCSCIYQSFVTRTTRNVDIKKQNKLRGP
jgi:hypothetical protein